jgi:hypothetical protein
MGGTSLFIVEVGEGLEGRFLDECSSTRYYADEVMGQGIWKPLQVTAWPLKRQQLKASAPLFISNRNKARHYVII